MIDMAARCGRLQNLLHREVPMSETMGMTVRSYDGQCLTMHAALEPNLNRYGVAFGGSIYSLCAMAGWGLLTLKLEEAELDARIMITGGEIEYLKPVSQTLVSASFFSKSSDFSQFSDEWLSRQRARIRIPVEILLEDGSLAARFMGGYIAIAREQITRQS